MSAKNGGTDDVRVGTGGNDRLSGGRGDDILLGGAGNDRLSGGRGNDRIQGGAGNDHLNGGGGNDTILGGAGNDVITGGGGNDVLDGGAGSDHVTGGAGSDTAIYRMSENAGACDAYDGKAGYDTLQLEFTRNEWLTAAVQSDIGRFLAFLTRHGCGEFDFHAFNLEARNFEAVRILVDGVEVTATDHPVTARNDAFTVGEDGSVAGSVVANDTVPDVVGHVDLLSGPSGGRLSFNPDGTFAYDTNGAFASLAAGETVTVSFTYRVSDTDGDTATATATITVSGANDAPVVTGAVTGSGHEGTGAFLVNLLQNASDVDHGAVLHVADLLWTDAGNGLPAGFSISPDGNSIAVDADNPAYDALVAGETFTAHFSYDVLDEHGASVHQTASITLTGTDDAPTLSAGTPSAALIEAGTSTAGVSASVVSLTKADVDGTASYDTTGWTQFAATMFRMDGTYGSAVLDTAADTLTYTLDNARSATDALTQGQHVADSFTIVVKEADGGLMAATPVTFAITGSDDVANHAPVIDLGGASTVSYLGAPTLVSTSANGAQGNNDSLQPWFSPDGTKVAFTSLAGNLVPGDTNGSYDVFIKDLATGATTRASTDATGQQGNSGSFMPVFSPDGTRVAFLSAASNLVAGDTNGHQDVFVKDLTTGAIIRASTDATGVQGDGDSFGAVFSPDATKVAFYSLTGNLAPGDAPGPDIFVKDLTTGAITHVAADANGFGWNYVGELPSFSPDGTKLLFDSNANLAAGQNGAEQIYTKDLTTGAVSLLSTDANGVAGNSDSFLPVYSPDGTKVAFQSSASNLVAGDTNGTVDIFVKDLATGAITRVSTAAGGIQGNDGSIGPVFSADGTRVAFASVATNLVPGDTNNAVDIFIKDLTTGAITRISTDANGQQGNNGSTGLTSFSADGTKVAFWSVASNLVANDTNGGTNFFGADVFVRPIVHASGAVVDNPAAVTLAADGHFSFSDADLSDVHAVSISAQSGARGTLTASVSHDTGTGSGGLIDWHYQVAESTVHALTTPQTDAFAVTLDDGHGGTATTTITIALLHDHLLL